jgi:hypothetical protein
MDRGPSFWIPPNGLGTFGVPVCLFCEARFGPLGFLHFVKQLASVAPRRLIANSTRPYGALLEFARGLKKSRVVFEPLRSFPRVLPDKSRGDANTSINT